MRYSRVFPAGLAISAAALIALGACDTLPYPTASAYGSPIGGPSALTVTPASASIGIGQSVGLVASNDTATLEWTSSLPDVASVSTTGLVTGLSAGIATITVRVRSDTTQRAQATVTVTGSTTGTP